MLFYFHYRMRILSPLPSMCIRRCPLNHTELSDTFLYVLEWFVEFIGTDSKITFETIVWYIQYILNLWKLKRRNSVFEELLKCK